MRAATSAAGRRDRGGCSAARPGRSRARASVSRQTSVARSFVYVASSGDRRRMYAVWRARRDLVALGAEQLARTSARAAPERWRSRVARTPRAPRESSRSEIPFSSSFRSTASGMPESSAASSSLRASSSSRSALNVALASAWIRPSASRSAYDGSTASRACAVRSGISSPLNVDPRGEQRCSRARPRARPARRRSARPRTSCGAGRGARARHPSAPSSALARARRAARGVKRSR